MNEELLFDLEAVFDPDDYLYFYKDILTEELNILQVEFLVKTLSLKKKHKILELACGYGRHSNRLAEMGFKVTGLDYIKGFLKIASAEAKKLNLPVKYVHGDMRDLPYKNEFDRVDLLFTAFGYFVDEENFQVLENVSRALKKGGLFCFDLMNRDVFLKNFKPCFVHEKEGNFMIDRLVFDSLTGRNYTKRIVIRNGVLKHKPFFVRLYNYTELRDLLERAGMEIVESYGSFKGEQFGNDSARMIIVARKV
ncbi:MAG: class I SAM-dependent methyltransferase [Candidatus Wallbacteria bacterium]|nr:class I SAM-dependent methyltransferase [Candidatus Wallbacteria bacterium]